MSHKKNVLKNTVVMFFCYIIQVLLGFIVRRCFIDALGVISLGYNAVFSNILTILNLSELGIGIAANSFLYKSIAQENYEEVNAIVHVLKKMYRYVVLLVLLLGGIIALFVPVLIPNPVDSYGYIYLCYFLVLLSTICSYLVSYRKTLIISEQKNYVVVLYESISYILISALQIATMYYFKNFILYLLLNVFKFILSGILIYLYSKKKCSYLTKNANLEIQNKYKKDIGTEIKNIFIAKVGGAIFHGTDNIIISSILGSVSAGLLSNYTLVTTALQNLITQVYGSIQATLGHYMNVEQDEEKQLNIYMSSLISSFIFGIVSMVGVIFVLPNFVSILFGKELLLSIYVAVLLGVNLLLMIILQVPNQIFSIYKLYKYDKYIVLVSATLNIVISLGLVFLIGIEGVLLGTTITLMIYLISRCYIIKKYIYKEVKYSKVFLQCFICSGLTIGLNYFFNVFALKPGFLDGIMFNGLIVVIFTALSIFIVFGRSSVFKQFLRILKIK